MKNLYLDAAQCEERKAQSLSLPSWDLTPEQTVDLELILSGAFGPLDGFMTKAECKDVEERKRWRDHFWPIPISLDVSEAFADKIAAGNQIALRDQEGLLVAVLTVSETFPTPGDSQERGPICLAGKLEGIEPPVHHDFKLFRLSPEELQTKFDKMGWHKVMGFMTRQPLHQRELNETYNAARSTEANLLLNLAVGAVRPEDGLHYARVHCLEHVLDRYPSQTTDLVLTPLYQRHRGLDDALLHAIVLRNQGCTHYMLDREYCPMGETGQDYGQIQETLSAYNEKLGIEIVQNEPMVHSQKRGGYVLADQVAEGEAVNEMSADDFAERLKADLDIPDWYSFPEVVEEMRKVHRPCSELGVTVFFTGLSGSGKSSIANALLVKMMEMGGRPITLLDGDIVRQNLSSELGFSKEHRDLNIRRIGYVASEITKHGGMAICAPIAPYAHTRQYVRDIIEEVGGFVEVYVATSLEVCEARDRKGLYAKARAGVIKEFTGISDPYEAPQRPELKIDTQGISPEEAAQRVILTLEKLGYIKLL